MFTAKTLLKASFLSAKARVAAMPEAEILYEDDCAPYEASHDLMFRRAIRRAARKIADDNWSPIEPFPADPEPEPFEVLDLAALLAA